MDFKDFTFYILRNTMTHWVGAILTLVLFLKWLSWGSHLILHAKYLSSNHNLNNYGLSSQQRWFKRNLLYRCFKNKPMNPFRGVTFDPRAIIWKSYIDVFLKTFHTNYFSFNLYTFRRDDFFKDFYFDAMATQPEFWMYWPFKEE
jgi:hypothetical protein